MFLALFGITTGELDTSLGLVASYNSTTITVYISPSFGSMSFLSSLVSFVHCHSRWRHGNCRMVWPLLVKSRCHERCCLLDTVGIADTWGGPVHWLFLIFCQIRIHHCCTNTIAGSQFCDFWAYN